jgi:hypothetical protein
MTSLGLKLTNFLSFLPVPFPPPHFLWRTPLEAQFNISKAYRKSKLTLISKIRVWWKRKGQNALLLDLGLDQYERKMVRECERIAVLERVATSGGTEQQIPRQSRQRVCCHERVRVALRSNQKIYWQFCSRRKGRGWEHLLFFPSPLLWNVHKLISEPSRALKMYDCDLFVFFN